ncbi:Thioredoxin family protein [Babesia bovis T2Bo]|uniref:Protein disulfide-isomerase, putative n=1 Tax=Babesia bovis TaxID=5865 RepID=A7AV78_BABBO|nr:Thioredoxin family protein [Babesia bovis T2Bo]EDO05704.1 Thioredoxin family protein [Babesia bovis T2Bo]|eukprot:XP_001609272.1 protein disulfide-isomerase [Babesia bovis T2Bo]
MKRLTSLLLPIASWLLATKWANVIVNAYLVIPDPPIAEQLTDDTYDDFLKSTDKTAIVFAYPSAAVFGHASLSEFAMVSKMLEGNPKCKLGIYQINLTINSPVESMKSTLSYLKDGELVYMPGDVNKVALIMAWITKERICDPRLQSIESTRYYLRALEPGYVNSLLIMQEDHTDEKLANNIYDIILESGYNMGFMIANKNDLVHYAYKMHRLSEESIMPLALMVTRNTPLQHPIKFLWHNLYNLDKVRTFLDKELVPPVHCTNSFMLDDVMAMNKTMIYLFTKDPNLDEYIDVDWLKKFALENNDKFVFIHSKGDDTVEERLNSLLVIDSDYVETAVRAFEIHPGKNEFVKFRPLDDHDNLITEPHLVKFINDMRDGKIRHFVKSEMPIPERIDVGHVKTIVGEDFHRRVIDSEKDVLILFFSPWCGHCHHAKRVFRDLGRRVKGMESVVVAKFDAYNNEVENTTVSEFPTVVLYPHGAKHQPIQYTGKIVMEDLAHFLETECKKSTISSHAIKRREVDQEQLFERHSEL